MSASAIVWKMTVPEGPITYPTSIYMRFACPTCEDEWVQVAGQGMMCVECEEWGKPVRSKIKYDVSVGVTYRHTLDTLVRRNTAFGTLYDMVESMEEGYIPTLSDQDLSADSLARKLQELGFEVHPPRTGKPACQSCVDNVGKMYPSHEGSPTCESGSLASGGRNPHCTCGTCF